MAPANYGRILGRNISAARNRLGISQDDVAARMRELSYDKWVRQTVSKSEGGTQRRVTADEVIALALCLETTVPSLMAPFDVEELDPVELQPGGRSIFANDVGYVAIGKKVPAGALRWEGNRLVVTARMTPDFVRETLRMVGLNEHGERP
jgi:transcriptional regulator with XRE-family HTH domain